MLVLRGGRRELGDEVDVARAAHKFNTQFYDVTDAAAQDPTQQLRATPWSILSIKCH